MTNLAFPPILAIPASVTDDEQLGEQITLLAGQINAANHRLLKLIAEFDLRKAWSGGGTVRSCADTAEKQQDNARELVYYQDDDGMWIIHAKLPPEDGALVVKALEAVATKDAENDSAETFSEVVEQEEPNTFQQLLTHTRADALVKITEHFLATTHDGRFQGLKGSERCQVVLHVDIDTLRTQGERCHLDEKPWIAPQTAKRLCCDASLVTVLEDKHGNVLNVGRRSRTVPANISRALKERDKTCRFPGCCESRYVDVHHIQHWADGGETSLDNLVTLCRYHHRQLHREGFSIAVEQQAQGAHFVFTTPSGKRFEQNLFPQFQKDSAESSEHALRAMAAEVGTTTCVTAWRGERCDYGMAVDALLWRDGQGQADDTASMGVC
jgi:hypothetical protein